MSLRQSSRCPLSTPCVKHGYYHGAEAEELREGIEKIIEMAKPVRQDALRDLLDRVDARDSLAYLETRALHEKEEDAAS